jgi:O-antigen ligase
LLVLGFILVFSVIPVPPPPWSFLPYIFLVMVAIGVVLSVFCGCKMGTDGREDVYAVSAAADDPTLVGRNTSLSDSETNV